MIAQSNLSLYSYKKKGPFLEQSITQDGGKMAAKETSIQEDYMLGKGFRESARSAVLPVIRSVQLLGTDLHLSRAMG